MLFWKGFSANIFSTPFGWTNLHTSSFMSALDIYIHIYRLQYVPYALARAFLMSPVSVLIFKF
jgi:hypothetical protein